MAARRLSVRKIKEVLRLHHEKGLSTRQIAKSLDISRSTIREYLDRVQQAGLGWPLPSELDEASLEHRLFPSLHAVPQEKRQMLSPEYLHRELKKKGVRLIDEKPRVGMEGGKIAFVHPKSTKGVLLELVEKP